MSKPGFAGRLRTLLQFSWAAGGLIAAQSSGARQNPVPSSPPPHLTVVAQAGVERTAPDAGRHVFGRVSLLQTVRLDYTFALRNDSRTALVIDTVQTSCGCTSGLLAGKDKSAHPTIAPGETVALPVSLDLTQAHPGPFSKYVWVNALGAASPVATLEIAADLAPAVTFTPSVLNFGALAAGKGAALTLTAALDTRLLAAGRPPRLLSSNPDVEITAAPAPGPPPVSSPLPPIPASKTIRLQTYTLRLSPRARLGQVRGTVSFEPPAPGANLEGTTADRATVALKGVQALLTGQVVGSLRANPQILVFGSVVEGRTATQRITLVGVAPGALDGLKISCTLASLTARLLPTRVHAALSAAPLGTPADAALPERILEATLDGQTPPGGLQAEICITTAKGERLIVPVLGSILRAPTGK